MLSLAEAIRSVRKRLGKTTTEFGAMLGTHNATVSRYERGKLTPSASMLLLLLNYADSNEREPILSELGIAEDAVAGLTGDEISGAAERFRMFLEAGGEHKRDGETASDFASLAERVLQGKRAPIEAVNRILHLWITWQDHERADEFFQNAALYLDIEFKALGAAIPKSSTTPRRKARRTETA